MFDYAKGAYSRLTTKMKGFYASDMIDNLKRQQRDKSSMSKIEKLSLGTSYMDRAAQERSFKGIGDRDVLQKSFGNGRGNINSIINNISRHNSNIESHGNPNNYMNPNINNNNNASMAGVVANKNSLTNNNPKVNINNNTQSIDTNNTPLNGNVNNAPNNNLNNYSTSKINGSMQMNNSRINSMTSANNSLYRKQNRFQDYSNIPGSPESRKSSISYKTEEHQIKPHRARYLSPYDHHSYSNPENESKGSLQLKELMHNINIMCMMENNYRKFFSQKKDLNSSIVSRCFEKNEIVLGKRGRPSKSSSHSPCSIPEKVMGSYLSVMQSTRDTLRSAHKSKGSRHSRAQVMHRAADYSSSSKYNANTYNLNYTANDSYRLGNFNGRTVQQIMNRSHNGNPNGLSNLSPLGFISTSNGTHLSKSMKEYISNQQQYYQEYATAPQRDTNFNVLGNGILKYGASYRANINRPKKPKSLLKQKRTQTERSKESKQKEKRNVKPVYFDDILMETLKISQKVETNKNVFRVTRKSVFEKVNERIIAFSGNRLFTQRIAIDLVTHHYIGGLREFDLLQNEQMRIRRGEEIRPRGDMHYNFGIFLSNPKGKRINSNSGLNRSFSGNKAKRNSDGKGRRKKKRKRERSKRKVSIGSEDLREKKLEHICVDCNMKFDDFVRFLNHIQCVHKTNVEEVL